MFKLLPRTLPVLVVGFLLLPASLLAQAVLTGKITNTVQTPLAYASVYVKGNTKGTVANSEGLYSLELAPGSYTIVCAFVGYQKQEKKVEVKAGKQTVDFQLNFQQTELTDVVVKANAEDPAYEIIRNAIKKRKEYLNEVKQWQTTVYMKGMIRMFKLPERILGRKLDPNRDVIDSTGKGIVYFSESLTRYSRRLPNDFKEEVISAKVSGNSSGFGFNSPQDLEINLYENNIQIEGLNSRGFVSPISENALSFYRYKYEGGYFEDGKEVLRIKVMPRRKYEPLFAGGFIEIIDGSWRIHGVNLGLNKASQIELVDSLLIRQQYFPVNNKVWMPQNTEISATFGIFGIKAGASFVAVYSDYDFSKDVAKSFDTRVIKSVDTAANKKSLTYWDSIRPMPLTGEERLDYLKKDTLEKKFNDPRYIDSLSRRGNKLKPLGLLISGYSYTKRSQKWSIRTSGILTGISYNTVEKWVFEATPSFVRWGDTGAFSISTRLRYGFGSQRLYASGSINKTIGKDYRKRWSLSLGGGQNIYQINPTAPIQPLNNSLATLLYTANYMKLFQKTFGSLAARRALQNGMVLRMQVSYEDRKPLDNIDTTYKWRQFKDRRFTSNYPEELPGGAFVRHQALITTVGLRWQPGIRFIEYPNRRFAVGSEKPVFNLNLTKAWSGVLGADANFGKWLLSIEDGVNMKLGGTLNYYAEVGGFINNKNVQLPDWRHFNGNQTIVASPFVRSFQLAPYYANSTRDRFFTAGHVEWHLNGLLTNKIPLFRRLNWNLVTGSNAFLVDANRNYVEVFVGLENIFKTLRVDWVAGYDGFNKKPTTGIVIGFSGLLTGQGVD